MSASLAVATVLNPAAAADFPDPGSLPSFSDWPDPLVMRDGTRITTKEDWLAKRAPELRALFAHYMYGDRPAAPAKVQGTVLFEDKEALGGTATLREVAVDCGLAAPVNLLIAIPNQRDQAAPCFLGMNFGGNAKLLDEPKIAPARWVRDPKADPGRGKEKETWAIEQSIHRGYAVATFYSGDVVPDDPQLAEQALAHFRAAESKERGPADPATIMAWSWGFSRMLDYLVTVPEIDGHRVAVVGHSRNGKTALLAAAFDERIALAIPSQAGCGGSAPDRLDPELAKPQKNGRPTAETVPVINKAFPHWFCGNFKRFNEAVTKLPFDQHALVALCAPRPVLLSCAEQDRWANPDGQYQVLRAAAPVYSLFGEKLSLPEARPAVSELLNERLGYYIRPGVHSMTKDDWKVWLDYADKWLKGPPAGR